MNFIEIILSSIFLSYFIYITTFIYNIIPMFIQIIFSYIIERKNIFKTTITVFFTQGIVLAIAQFIYDILYDIYRYSENLGFWNNILSENILYNIFYILILIIILILINYLIYKNQIPRINYKNFIYLTVGYLFNLIVVVFIMIKFNILFILP